MFGLHRNYLPPKKQSTVSWDVARYPRPIQNQAQRGATSVRQSGDPDALKKITALESELLNLRAQIAMIVTGTPPSGEHSHHISASFSQKQQLVIFNYQSFRALFTLLTGLIEPQNVPGPTLMSPPALTSTPRCVAPPPPPPPPPPPLPGPKSSTETLSALELIRQRRKDEKGHNKGQFESRDSAHCRGLEVKGTPSMLDVLKDLNQVKLRTVER